MQIPDEESLKSYFVEASVSAAFHAANETNNVEIDNVGYWDVLCRKLTQALGSGLWSTPAGWNEDPLSSHFLHSFGHLRNYGAYVSSCIRYRQNKCSDAEENDLRWHSQAVIDEWFAKYRNDLRKL
ncbi:hypothetical protein [Streptomyces sp. NPDC047981]|uniref:hypothetical protein n=1 Tax=Streptomyces sp. NPDC047981 TaxID=3154610 RepID=UPI00344793B1